ncbi:HK97 family phage prohead protease [Enterococcus asini]|uniref:HK97 family phage prohead protease n=1 Tax=Enterococcus asini TaxID=57732 RepID=UPI00266CABA5|nr:HK97 family phage prohead protease [Enterococcus asini]
MKEMETRQLTTTMELRELENNEEIIEGYALKFNQWSNPLGIKNRFVERINSRALEETDMSNTVARVNHDKNQIVGRANANMDLEVDDIGLKFRIKPNNSTVTRDLIENIRSGLINQCSFAFTVAQEERAQEWVKSEERGMLERTINKIDKLFDVSMVTTPAYNDTEVVVGTRGLEMVEELTHNPNEQEIKRMLDDLDKEEILNTL